MTSHLNLMLAFSHVTCTRDSLAAGSELPRSCRNHSSFHTQRYCHKFANSRLRLVSFLTSPARFFFKIKRLHRAGSDGSMSASGSAGPGFDPRRGSKFSFENFQPLG